MNHGWSNSKSSTKEEPNDPFNLYALARDIKIATPASLPSVQTVDHRFSGLCARILSSGSALAWAGHVQRDETNPGERHELGEIQNDTKSLQRVAVTLNEVDGEIYLKFKVLKLDSPTLNFSTLNS